MNGYLRDRIQERARLAWNRPNRMVPENLTASWLLPIGRFFRLHGGPVRFAVAKVTLPVIFLAIIFGGAMLAGGRSYYNWRAGTGRRSAAATDAPKLKMVEDEALPFYGSEPVRHQTPVLGNRAVGRERAQIPHHDRRKGASPGSTTRSCRGLKRLPALCEYSLSVHALSAAGIYRGLVSTSAAYRRRRATPNCRSQQVNVMPADDLPRLLNPMEPKDKKKKKPVRVDDDELLKANSELQRVWSKFGILEPIPDAALPAARKVWHTQGLADRMVAEFVAGASGEVFLYVNDAVLPFLPPFTLFYANNSGKAEVTLQRSAVAATQISSK